MKRARIKFKIASEYLNALATMIDKVFETKETETPRGE